MFGIGFSEMVLIAIVLIIAVGPNKLPTMLKAIGKAMREFRRATRELRAQSGIDDLMNDEDLRDLRRPLTASSPQRKHVGAPPAREPLDAEAKRKEYPPEGVDFAASAEMPAPAVTPPPGPTVAPAGTNGANAPAAEPAAKD